MELFVIQKRPLAFKEKKTRKEKKRQRKGKQVRQEIREEKQKKEREREGKEDKQRRISEFYCLCLLCQPSPKNAPNPWKASF